MDKMGIIINNGIFNQRVMKNATIKDSEHPPYHPGLSIFRGDHQERSKQNNPFTTGKTQERVKCYSRLSKSTRCWNIQLFKINNPKDRCKPHHMLGVKINKKICLIFTTPMGLS